MRAQRQLVHHGARDNEGCVLVAAETRYLRHELERHPILVEHIIGERRLAYVN